MIIKLQIYLQQLLNSEHPYLYRSMIKHREELYEELISD